VRITLRSSFFRLVVPPLHLGVVGRYPIQGTWFPSHLSLEETGPYPEFWALIGDLWYSGHKTSTPLSHYGTTEVSFDHGFHSQAHAGGAPPVALPKLHDHCMVGGANGIHIIPPSLLVNDLDLRS
jgi:hypothetical protein